MGRLYGLRFMIITSLFSWVGCEYPKALCFAMILVNLIVVSFDIFEIEFDN